MNTVCLRIDGNFSLWIKPRIYKIIRTRTGFIKNTKTGENCGNIVYLYAYYYDKAGNKLTTPLYDDNCYEIVPEDIK